MMGDTYVPRELKRALRHLLASYYKPQEETIEAAHKFLIEYNLVGEDEDLTESGRALLADTTLD